MSSKVFARGLLCAFVPLGVILACDDDARPSVVSGNTVDAGDGSTGAEAAAADAQSESDACRPKTCSVAAKECGTVPNGCGGFLDCGPCAVGLCGAVQPNECGCPDPNETFASEPKTARRARSSGFSGTVEKYAELFDVACTAASECDAACTDRGGTAEMCQASECVDDSSGKRMCLPPPIWTNLESIQYEATSLTDAIQQVVVATPYQDLLLVDQFALEVPPTATIEGITVEVRRASTGSIGDASVRIVKGGTVGTSERAGSGEWGGEFEWVTYGGPSDLWGETWTPADLVAADFGVALSALYMNTVGNSRAYVDQVRVTVHYRVVCG